MDIVKFINTPIIIGDKKIKNRMFLAPMAGLGHIAFRHLISEFGGYGLMFTGMCSAMALPTENRNISPVFQWRDEELPFLVCQIFGPEPEIIAKAAKRVEKEGFFGIDINMGCSVSAICKKKCGAALLKTPDKAVNIVKAVRDSVSIPVFVKYRTGWDDYPDLAIELAQKFEEAGADALTFHPRVAPDRRSRPPKWTYISLVKKAVSIPVFGNGNIFNFSDCKTILEKTKCDGVSIGRAAIASPWLFKTIAENYNLTYDIYQSCALEMHTLLLKYYSPQYAIKLFKKFALYFAANFKFGHEIYKNLCKAQDMDQIRQNILIVLQKCPETTSTPNLNMFL